MQKSKNTHQNFSDLSRAQLIALGKQRTEVEYKTLLKMSRTELVSNLMNVSLEPWSVG